MNNYRIVFMGTPQFAVPALSALCEHGYTPLAVYTQPDKINGRGKKISFSPVKQFAIEHNIEVRQPISLRGEEEIKKLAALKPDLIVVIAYGKILPQAVLDAAKYGAINIHGSLLPQYRGAAPVQRAIIEGKKKTGITIMHLDAGMDTGPMISTRETEITPHMTAGELFDVLSQMGADELIRVMDHLPEALAAAVSQDHSKATYAEKVTKDMSRIYWTDKGAVLDCLIRGMYPDPGTFTMFREKRLKIHRAFFENVDVKEEPGTILSIKDGLIRVVTGEGVIVLSEIQPENKKAMAARDFINGYQVKEHEHFE